MDRETIEGIVISGIRIMNLARTQDNRVEESSDAVLYGPASPLDSLGLVSLLIEVEEGMRDAGVEISLSDERAISQKHSPFRNVPTLVAYIEELLAERHS